MDLLRPQLIDAASALERVAPDPAVERLCRSFRYHATVFFTPPWPEIFTSDPERRHGLAEATAEYERLERAYPDFGYRVVVLPRADVRTRADLVCDTLAATCSATAASAGLS